MTYPAIDNFICPKCKTADGLTGIEAVNSGDDTISGTWFCSGCGSVITFVIATQTPRHTCSECGEEH